MNTLPDAFCSAHPAQRFAGLDRTPLEEQRRAQGRLLAEQVARAARAPFYAKRLRAAGVDPAAFTGLDMLRRLPFTTKDDLTRENEAFLAVDPCRVADWCMTSATSSPMPTALWQSQADLARLACNESGAFAIAGMRAGDVVLVCAALDRCFMAGLAYYFGAVQMGCQVVRGGAQSPAQLWELARRCRPQVIVGVPSLMRKAAEHAAAHGQQPAALGVRLLVCIGEALRDRGLAPLPSTVRLEALWGAKALSTYASTEMATSFMECPQAHGNHLRPELAVVEVVDEAGEPVPAGEVGEVVCTPLMVEATPLLRFRTGDLAWMDEAPCACGRLSPRLSPVLGRRSQMLKVKGTTLFPGSLLAMLDEMEEAAGGVVEARRDPDDGCDRVTVVAAAKPGFSLTPQQVAQHLRNRARITLDVRVVGHEELERLANNPAKRKRQTFLDLR